MLFDNSFNKKITIKSPVQYSGGKHFARQILSEFVPIGITQIVSPFFGGGSLELYLTKRGIKVFGYDAFEPLVNFWQVIQKQPETLFEVIEYNLKTYDRASFQNMQEGGFDKLTCNTERAAMFYLLQCLSYNSRSFRGKSIRNFEFIDGKLINPSRKSWGQLFNINETKEFYNPFVSINLLDFRQSLVKHDALFAYCDPPYPEVTGIYGDSEEYHEKFDHEALKDILDFRTGDWMLSYNNCDTVRKLYPETQYKIYHPDWKQGSRASGRGNEVLIKPK